MSDIKAYGLKAYVARNYDLHIGKRLKYTESGEDAKERIFEVVQMFTHCILLEDIFDHTKICPSYSKLSLMLRGFER